MQRDLFRDIFEQTLGFIGLLRADGTLIEANPAALAVRRLQPTDVIGKPFWDTAWFDISAEGRKRLRTAIELASREKFTRFECDLLNAEGEVATYDFVFKPMHDDSGGVAMIVAEGREITERKRVEEALRRARDELELRVQSRTAELSDANERLMNEMASRTRIEGELRDSDAKARAILDTAVDAIITITDRGIIESLNPAAEEVFGYKQHEVAGKNIKMLMPEPYQGEHDQYMRNYLRTGVKKIIGIGREVVGLRKDGSTFPMELAVSEVRIAGGSRMFTGIVRDITERRRMEREILEISGNEQRRIGQDLHDGLGQQLTGIALLTRVLSDELASNKSLQSKSAKKIAELVQEAISWTRYLARGLSPIGLDAHGLPSALTELAKHTTEVLGIRCDLKSPSAVRLDDAAKTMHLYRIAQEAVTNAIRHGKPKRISIELKLSDARLTLRVSDNGVGYAGEAASPRGMGIQTMLYRARMIGATLSVARRRPSGTIVACTLPRTSTQVRRSNHAAKAPRKTRPSRK